MKDLESIVVASRNGAALRVGDVATVVEGFPAPIGDAVINSGPGLMLIVEKQLGANTLTVTRGVEQALEQMKPALSGVAVDPTIFRPATFIEMSLQNLSRALLVGCVLVILVLMVFLADWRTALISSIAIPLSLLAAGLLLHYRGGTLDTMVLAGLVIALGEVVDDAIIDVENIVRRLRLNRVGGASPASDPRRARRVDGGAERRALRQPHRRGRVRAGVHARWAGWRVLPPARAVLRSGDSRVPARRADDHARAGAAAAAEASRSAGVATRRRVEGALPTHAAGVRRPAEDRARFAGSLAARDGPHGAVSRRGVPSQLPRVPTS